MDEGEYAAGGLIPGGGPTWVALDPDECVINRDRECVRAGHPTATSDGNKPGAWWRCEPKP